MAHTTVDFDRLVEDTMNEWKVPGLAIAVITGDDIFAKGYGMARFPSKKVTPDTLFDCASTSKSFTAGAVALLVENDDKYPNVQWTTPVSQLLQEDFVLADPLYTDNVTIEDILSHRSGMPRHDDSYLGIHAAKPDTPKSVTRNLRNLPLSRPLRTEYQYCNMMYTAASHMVEVLSSEPYAEFLKSHLWDPLQMSNTYHDVSGVEFNQATDRLASGYIWREKANSYNEVPMFDQPEGQGAGSIYSCVNDYAKWIRSMLKLTGPLSQNAQKEVVKPRSIIHLDDEDRIPFYSQPLYALGWAVENYRGLPVVGHDGSATGFQSLMRYLPKQEWGIVIFGNSDSADDAANILFGHLMDEHLDIPVQERVDWAAFWRKSNEKSKKEDDLDLPMPPDPPLPMTLPLSSFVGKYNNAGYHDIILEIKDGKLYADLTDRYFGVILSLEHVSQDIFIAEIQDPLDDEKSRIRAEFQVDAEGRVSSFGVAFVEEMKGHMIWFSRAEQPPVMSMT